ncbi:YmaF family protein [Clostridium tepidiprofundi DSM 19306]|uniref:YmaF family protein n=1 Tax=Clostridium tepidiprofundi DSM 19306 TaxID=1121338 RepID=A0A151B266_9CLOT|nr:YmaF family protein [Clostridium tepidiprofundi]KYH34019.1 YmaF family protein [Clostridium tepidiprofundi DSM 19306]
MSRNCCCHRHKYSGYTTCNCGHAHKCKGKTTYAPYDPHHIHYCEAYTKKEDGHCHCYLIPTSEPIPAPCGGHYHYINGPVEFNDCHNHHFNDCTSVE